MNLIDQQVNNYRQSNFQVPEQGMMSSPMPYYQGVMPNSNQTSAEDAFVPGKKKGPSKLMLILGSWLGISKLMDCYNNTCTKDNYAQTIMGKMGNWGDKMSAKYGSNSLVKGIKAGFAYFKAQAKKYIDSKPVLSAMFNTPTRPEDGMVLGLMESQVEADLKEATRTIGSYIEEMPKTLAEAGATKAEKQAFAQKYGKNWLGQVKNETLAIQELELTRIGASLADIQGLAPEEAALKIKELKIRHLGLEPETYKKVLDNPMRHKTEITEACRRGGKNARAIFGRAYTLVGGKRSTNLSMSYNKLLAESSHTSKLGKALAKSSKMFMRALTFGGGKVNALLIALGIGTAAYNTIQAPKKQKTGTAVAGGVEAVSWIVSMPLAIKVMHAVNGLQYKGMSKMDVGRFRVALRNFNKKADMGGFATRAEYDTALKAVMDMKKAPAANASIFTKAVNKIAKFLSIGLETPHGFKEPTAALSGSAKTGAFMRNIKNMLPKLGKNIVGYPLRFALYMFAFSPIVEKLISSCTSAIFGKPYEEPEEEQPEENQKLQQQQGMPVSPEQMMAYQAVQNNMINNAVQPEVHDNPNRRYIPSEDCNVKLSENDKRSYIPSDESAVRQSTNTNPELSRLLKRSQQLDKYYAAAVAQAS